MKDLVGSIILQFNTTKLRFGTAEGEVEIPRPTGDPVETWLITDVQRWENASTTNWKMTVIGSEGQMEHLEFHDFMIEMFMTRDDATVGLNGYFWRLLRDK